LSPESVSSGSLDVRVGLVPILTCTPLFCFLSKAKFAQLYLPKFFEAFRFLLTYSPAQSTDEARIDETEFEVYYSLVALLARKGPFGRYVREHDEAAQLVPGIVDFLVDWTVSSTAQEMVVSSASHDSPSFHPKTSSNSLLCVAVSSRTST